MPSDVLILIATAVLAVVAVSAAVVSVRNVKEIRKTLNARPTVGVETKVEAEAVLLTSEPLDDMTVSDNRHANAKPGGIVIAEQPAAAQVEFVPHHGQVARIVDGDVVVTPTRAQVANAIMGQPRVRFAIWMTGLAHALRPESRDRILGMMRRDYRDRRRHREQAGRAAIRAAHSPAVGAEEWRGNE